MISSVSAGLERKAFRTEKLGTEVTKDLHLLDFGIGIRIGG